MYVHMLKHKINFMGINFMVESYKLTMTTVNQKFAATCESIGDIQIPHPNARANIASVAPGMMKMSCEYTSRGIHEPGQSK